MDSITIVQLPKGYHMKVYLESHPSNPYLELPGYGKLIDLAKPTLGCRYESIRHMDNAETGFLGYYFHDILGLGHDLDEFPKLNIRGIWGNPMSDDWDFYNDVFPKLDALWRDLGDAYEYTANVEEFVIVRRKVLDMLSSGYLFEVSPENGSGHLEGLHYEGQIHTLGDFFEQDPDCDSNYYINVGALYYLSADDVGVTDNPESLAKAQIETISACLAGNVYVLELYRANGDFVDSVSSVYSDDGDMCEGSKLYEVGLSMIP